MHGFKITICFLLFLTSIVYGDETFDVKKFKELFLPNAAAKVTPLNAKSCDENQLANDVANQCGSTPDLSTCNSAQKYVDCATGVVYKDCDYDELKKLCDRVDQYVQQIHSNCDIKCSASSLFITGCIAAIVFFKIFFEKIVSVL